VLRPTGVLVLMWNVPAGPTEPSIAAAEELLGNRGPRRGEVGYDPLDLCSPRFESGDWRRAFAESPFGELQEAHLPNPQTIDREGLVAFFGSMGWIADCATTIACLSSTKCGRCSAQTSTGGTGRPVCTGRGSRRRRRSVRDRECRIAVTSADD
jgi:hypothetical protein